MLASRAHRQAARHRPRGSTRPRVDRVSAGAIFGTRALDANPSTARGERRDRGRARRGGDTHAEHLVRRGDGAQSAAASASVSSRTTRDVVNNYGVWLDEFVEGAPHRLPLTQVRRRPRVVQRGTRPRASAARAYGQVCRARTWALLACIAAGVRYARGLGTNSNTEARGRRNSPLVRRPATMRTAATTCRWVSARCGVRHRLTAVTCCSTRRTGTGLADGVRHRGEDAWAPV